MNEYIKNVKVLKAKNKGLGCFVKKSFKKGDIIINIVPGRIITKQEEKIITPDSERWDNYDADHYYFMGDPEFYINHSCEPNVYVKNKKVIAMKNIKKGEEIYFDYRINGIDRWEMKCMCKSKDCTKAVNGSFFKLPQEKQKEYLPFLDTWFRKKFMKRLKN